VTRFHVRVAHAYYSESTPSKALWAVFTDGWFVAINNDKPMTFEQLKETFRAQGQAQYIDFLDHITKPQGKGDWTLSTNHLDPKNPAPQLWCTWKSELCIQDAVSLQDYPPFEASNNAGNGKGKGKARAYPTYPVTLLWYPRMEKTDPKSYGGYAWAEESLLPGGIFPVITSYDDDDDPVSVSELFARVDPTPMTTTTTAAGTHKRQISEAVLRDERLNGPETTPAAPQQQAQ
jgi:hypothetical protein